MSPEEVVKQFLDAYYQAQSTKANRYNLINFYTEQSCLTYNGDSYKGLKAIAHKIESLSYDKVNF